MHCIAVARLVITLVSSFFHTPLTNEEEVVDQSNHTGSRWPYTVGIVHFLLVEEGRIKSQR